MTTPGAASDPLLVIGLHDEVNERLELRVVPDLVETFRPELAAFLAGLGMANHVMLVLLVIPLAIGRLLRRTATRWPVLLGLLLGSLQAEVLAARCHHLRESRTRDVPDR